MKQIKTFSIKIWAVPRQELTCAPLKLWKTCIECVLTLLYETCYVSVVSTWSQPAPRRLSCSSAFFSWWAHVHWLYVKYTIELIYITNVSLFRWQPVTASCLRASFPCLSYVHCIFLIWRLVNGVINQPKIISKTADKPWWRK